MPKIRKVESLLGKCLHTVASHVANYNSNIQLEANSINDVKSEESSVSKCVVNPFDAWPSQLVKKLIGVLRFNGWLDIRHRDLLITAHSTELDLSSVSGFSDGNTADLFLQHAAHITVLFIGSACFIVNLKCYQEHLPQLKQLEVLDVSHSKERFDDSCLHILGIYCPNLREVDVTFCNVTDDGMEGLFGGPSSDLREDEPIGRRKSGQCKLIEKLLIEGTKVTRKGVQMALLHLHQLKIIDSWYVIEALALMHQNDKIRPKYGLTQLVLRQGWLFFWQMKNVSLGYMPYQHGALDIAVSMCSSVTRLNLKVGAQITDVDLLGLTVAVLEKLKDFEISTSEDGCNFTFEGGLAPLLQARGRSLKILKFHRSLPITVDLVSIIEYCPNLEHLYLGCHFSALNTGLEEESSRPIKRIKTDLVLKNLKRLYLVRDTDDSLPNIHSESLLLALSLSSTVNHLVVSCKDLDDGVLQQTFQHHSFHSLEVLVLIHCPLITKIGIDLFMNEKNNLKKLVILSCAVSNEDIVYLKETAKKMNWDLEIVSRENYDGWVLRPDNFLLVDF